MPSTLGFEPQTVSSLEPTLDSRLLPPRRAEQRRGDAGGQGEGGGQGQGQGARGVDGGEEVVEGGGEVEGAVEGGEGMRSLTRAPATHVPLTHVPSTLG